MDHEHSHEYMHEHGIPHDHHAHEADCPNRMEGCGTDCAGCEANPRAEVVALMRYMVNHNAAHAGELVQLANRLKELGDDDAFEQVTRAVSDFEKGNMRLAAVLAALDVPKD